jgi:hypothetical protein
MTAAGAYREAACGVRTLEVDLVLETDRNPCEKVGKKVSFCIAYQTGTQGYYHWQNWQGL